MTSCGRYEIIAPLGVGGMAEVFEGVAVSAGGITRRVAIKRLPPSRVAHMSARTMFFDEARIASHLNHGNVVGIIDYGEANGAPFLVMEFVDGLDAKIAQDEIGAGRIPPGLALHICTEIAYALTHAHGVCDKDGEPLGIVHRDVSPNNILLSWEGDVRLTDFGIATAYDRTSKTKTGLAKGKPAFMAPEQLLGGTVDGRTDCFSLGCTLHALIVGNSPLSIDDALPNFLNEQKLRLDPEIDEDIRKIIDSATHYRKNNRYESAEEMADALATARARHLGSDGPRRRLRDWMQPHQDKQRKRAHNTGIHALLGVDAGDSDDIAFVFDDTDQSVRRFSTVVVNKSGAAQGPKPPQKRGRKRGLAAMLIASGLALLAAIYLPAAPETTNSPDTLANEPGNDNAPTELVAPDAAPIRPDALPVVVDLPEERPPAPVEPTTRAQPTAPATVIPAPVGRRDATPPAPAARTPAASQLGAITIGGAGAHLSAVFVDGQRRGSAPRTLELPRGAHQIELRRRTEAGAWDVVGRRSILLDERHSRRSPLRWIIR